MICPTCDFDFANLKAHRCPVILDIEKLKELWTFKTIAFSPDGDIAIPNATVGLILKGKRKEHLDSTDWMGVEFQYISFLDRNEIILTTKTTDKYKKEIQFIVDNVLEFIGEQHKDNNFPVKKLNCHCKRCNTNKMPGICYNVFGASFALCVGCMLELVMEWYASRPKKTIDGTVK
jgi:hypothetical protein